jgi:DNA-binding NarL/FixJ family response regulator
VADTPFPRSLTRTKFEILQLVLEGRSNKEIAYRRGISEQAVKRHVSGLFRAFEVDGRARLLARAFSERRPPE